MLLQGKTAVVTGAGTGIGQAIAIAFVGSGADVVVDYVGVASISKDTLSQIAAMGARSLGIDADISNPDQVNDLIHQTVAAFGKLDYLREQCRHRKEVCFH